MDRSLILCQVNSKVVVFISITHLYITGLYICFPLQYSPLISIYNFHISKLSLPSLFHFHTSNIPHFSTVLIIFPAPPFRCSHFRLLIIPFCLPSSILPSGTSLYPAIPFLTTRATFLPYRQSYPAHKNVTRSHSHLCCITFPRGHRETAKTSTTANSTYKMTSRSAFSICRPRTGGHPSKY